LMISTKEKTNQSTLESIFQNASNNPKRKKEKDQALAKFIIYNSQLLTILSSQKFIAFCQALDPYYQVPNDKVLKRMINEAYLYNFIFSKIKQQVIQNFQQLYNEQRDTQNNSEIKTIPANINEDNHFQTMLFNMISSCNSELETD
ncbi:5437_t:CDS:2, partial [Gigaspora margarita]